MANKDIELWNAYYQESGAYVNKKNISNIDELEKYERNITDIKLNELHDNPIQGHFDIKHLRDIHRYLFDELYEWAGEYRDVYMKIEGKAGNYFAPVPKIDALLEEDILMLNTDMKYVYNIDTLADFITNHYVALVNVHPFREGNGRAIREFLREYIVNKTEILWGISYDLDWTRVNHTLIDELMPFGRAYSGVIRMEILKAIVPYKKENSVRK